MNGPGCFRTVVSAAPAAVRIAAADPVLCIGSCFAEHIGARLEERRFNVCLNPAGILFNPVSIAASLTRIIEGRPYCRDDLFLHDGLWHSFDHHGGFSAPDPDVAVAAINEALSRASLRCRSLHTLILTFGTAFVYTRADTGAVVANCHKLPHDRFVRTMVGVETVVETLQPALDRLFAMRPALNLIMTVSPVRHLRDDPHENSVSKSTLLLATDRLRARYPGAYYFPAYEIMMDDLRDYRFYEADMTHPSGAAADYIWRAFIGACVDPHAAAFIDEYEPVIRARGHRGRTACAAAAGRFNASIRTLIDGLERKYPEIDFTADKDRFADGAGR